MTNRQRNLGINIRVTASEKKKIERNAGKCKLSVSEYLRQLAMKNEPKELPSEEMMQSLMRLRKVIAAFEKNSVNAQDEKSREYFKNSADYIRQIMTETLQFMTHSEPRPGEVRIDGND
ncbi:MAG: hypothetical protein J6D57_11555 [Mogibacterium sp.]|nr:hypothetical protein [Mogibacterium sp.]